MVVVVMVVVVMVVVVVEVVVAGVIADVVVDSVSGAWVVVMVDVGSVPSCSGRACSSTVLALSESPPHWVKSKPLSNKTTITSRTMMTSCDRSL